jgi:hypothetical protein
MAVGTEEPKVRQPVVVVDPIDVIDMQNEPLSAPVDSATPCTRVLPAHRDQSLRESATVDGCVAVLHEDHAVGKRLCLTVRCDRCVRLFRFTAAPCAAAKVRRVECEIADPSREIAMRTSVDGAVQLCENLRDRCRLANERRELIVVSSGERDERKCSTLTFSLRRRREM